MLLLSALCSAQDTIRFPINEMKGVRIGIDNSKLIFPLIFKGERIGFEATADMHVKGDFFAVAEAGWLNVNLNRSNFITDKTVFTGRSGLTTICSNRGDLLATILCMPVCATVFQLSISRQTEF